MASERKTSVHIRVDSGILAQVDALAKRHETSRTAIILEALRDVFGIERVMKRILPERKK